MVGQVCMVGSVNQLIQPSGLPSMKLKNTTNVPESLLREVIRFVCPSSVTNFSIWFKRAGGGKRVFFAGRAYYDRWHIVCRIPKWERLLKPYIGAGLNAGRGYLPWVCVTYEESLVALVAHELTHFAQHLNPRLYRRTSGARGQYSERDCDTYANEMILAWRAAHGPETQAPTPRAARKGPKPLTPRQRLRALADTCGVELDFGSPSPDGIWVGPPSTLCDIDGVMDEDPYESEGHTCFDYHEAKERIEAYAKLVEAKTLSQSGVHSSSGAIGVDSTSEPAKMSA